jgi:uncharacterized protein RhaS with RHS repeats
MYYRGRYYDPTTGRFLSEDILEFNSGMNFYEYSYNSPVDFKDPSGNQPAPALLPPAPPVLTLINGGLAGGAGVGATFGVAVETGSPGGPIGVAVATIIVFGAYDVSQTYDLGIAYGWWGIKKPGEYIYQSQDSLNNAAANKENKCKKDDGNCWRLYQTDLETCRALKSSTCYAQAAERYAACRVGRPIPPFPYRRPN